MDNQTQEGKMMNKMLTMSQMIQKYSSNQLRKKVAPEGIIKTCTEGKYNAIDSPKALGKEADLKKDCFEIIVHKNKKDRILHNQ